ncbi:MAG: tetratricopeptide repeat protein [Candidatus Nealsonbacteria bacterium]|nr:tetratricopeptide repeat protein [Candidatus Nealsonbacteria bacterium]
MGNTPRKKPQPPRPLVGDIAAEKVLVPENLNVGRDFNMGAPPAQPRPTLTPPRELPPKNKKFVGRKRPIEDVHRLLQREGDVGITQEVAVHAHGGIGKTALAIEYAWQHLDDYPAGLFFISCDVDLLLPAVAALAGPLGIDEADTPEQTAAWVKAQLESDGPALLILDNVRDARQWNDAQWRKWLPGGPNCRRLITTRDERLPLPRYRLERLPQDEGIELLAKYRPVAEPNRETVGRVVEWFDGLAVGLTVVGAYMAEHPDLDWDRFVDGLEAKGLGAVRAIEDDVGGLPDYDRRVDAVFDDLLESVPPAHRRALEYAALLPEDYVLPLWLAWLLTGDERIELPELPGYGDDLSQPVINRLKGHGLLPPYRGDDTRLSMHRVLRRRLGELLADDGDHRKMLVDRLCALAEHRGEASHQAIVQPHLRDELTPLLRLSDTLLQFQRIDEAASLANWIHTPLHDLARTTEVRDSLERFIDTSLAPEGKATALSNLAMILKAQGDLPGARQQMERAIEIMQEHLLEDHPKLAIGYSNLATILKNQGDLPGAWQQMERSIEIWQKLLPEDHPNLATCYCNLATILQDQDDLPGARQQMERAIAIDEKHFPEDHPTLATSYSNLATILQAQGDLPGARQQMERAIEIDEKHFPEDHPDLAIRYNNLGHIELAEGREDQAREMFRRAYRIWAKHFTAEDPRVQMVVATLKKLGELPEGE